ncbi:MAG: alpha/beta hydrolase [Acidobacteria bacterium]|nr:alpha/beta hydrolase [Acidobacteriota bacterium]
MVLVGVVVCGVVAVGAVGQQQAGARRVTKDSSVIGADGTAYVTRVVPVPETVSPEAQKMLSRVETDVAKTQTLAEERAGTDKWQAGAGAESEAMYPVRVHASVIAGVPVRVVMPMSMDASKIGRVLINLHGGGFRVDSGSLTESVPMASLTGTKVISVLYRMAPEHPFPAAVDDAVAVYKDLLKSYQPGNIGIYGTSAGAILTAEVTAKLKQLGLPMPGATGVFSGMGDFSKAGDSTAMFSLDGLAGYLAPPGKGPAIPEYVGKTSVTDPVLSPMYSDMKGFPPTLFVTSERDLLLSGTTILHRAYLRAGVDAQLVVFEGLPHAFWNDPKLPESKEADRLMANFFDAHLGRLAAQ